MLLTFKASACFWPKRRSNSSFNSLHFRIHNVCKLHRKKKIKIYLATNYCPFSRELQKSLFLPRKCSGVSENEQTGLRKTNKEQQDLKRFVQKALV